MPTHVKNGRQVMTVGNDNVPDPLMEIDFITPDEGIKCLSCGLPGAIPLTCFCPQCDPLAIILQQDAETRPSRAVHWGYEPWQDPIVRIETIVPTVMGPISSMIRAKGQSPEEIRASVHSNVLLLPRPDTSEPPVEPTNTQRIRNALNSRLSVSEDGSALPAFLRRDPQLNLEQHDRLLK